MNVENRVLTGPWIRCLASCALVGSGCDARGIEGVQCGSDTDCEMGGRCADYVCVPSPTAPVEQSSSLALQPNAPQGGSLLDDFEQPNGVPRDSRFGRWFAGVFSSEECKQSRTGEVDTALVDGRLDFSWKVSDRLDGIDCYPAAGVATEPYAATVDLSGYGGIRFDVRHRRGDTSCVAAERLVISVGCEPTLFERVFLAPADWQTVSVPWTDFVQPDWAPDASVTIDACIRRGENVQVMPVPNLLDGQCQAGVISIESIWFNVAAL